MQTGQKILIQANVQLGDYSDIFQSATLVTYKVRYKISYIQRNVLVRYKIHLCRIM